MILTMVTRFECDDAMANAIIKLNEKGYGTRFCCSGHEEDLHPYISFTTNGSIALDLIEYTYYELPVNWVREVSNYNYRNAGLYRRFTEEEYLTKTDKELIEMAMQELNTWVDIIPVAMFPKSKVL